MHSLALLLFLPLLLLLPTARAKPYDPISCNADQNYRWMFSSEGDSPCRIATNVINVCQPGVNIWRDKNGTGAYALAIDNECQCSNVYYNLWAGCMACHEERTNAIFAWAQFTQRCTSGSFRNRTADIRNLNNTLWTSIPMWARMDVMSDSYTWSYTDSHENYTQEIASLSSLSLYSTYSTALGPKSTGGAAPSRGESSSSSSTTNAGAIAGGVIGGVSGLALIAALVWFFRRRSRRGSTSSEEGEMVTRGGGRGNSRDMVLEPYEDVSPYRDVPPMTETGTAPPGTPSQHLVLPARAYAGDGTGNEGGRESYAAEYFQTFPASPQPTPTATPSTSSASNAGGRPAIGDKAAYAATMSASDEDSQPAPPPYRS